MIEAAQKILNEISYATIATVSDSGEPWNTPVFYAHEGATLYWSSHPNSVHSKNIATNSKAFIVIYNSNAQQGQGIGLYMQTTVRVLQDEQEIARALKLLGERRGEPFRHIEKFIGTGPQRIYEATPLQMWTNDARKDSDGDFIEDFRTPVTTGET
ncbi:MAG TPA: pyridoxamine 5'-phosphate oxidase family protein [Candidatus Saccharimonadales bacterium]